MVTFRSSPPDGIAICNIFVFKLGFDVLIFRSCRFRIITGKDMSNSSGLVTSFIHAQGKGRRAVVPLIWWLVVFRRSGSRVSRVTRLNRIVHYSRCLECIFLIHLNFLMSFVNMGAVIISKIMLLAVNFGLYILWLNELKGLILIKFSLYF